MKVQYCITEVCPLFDCLTVFVYDHELNLSLRKSSSCSEYFSRIENLIEMKGT